MMLLCSQLKLSVEPIASLPAFTITGITYHHHHHHVCVCVCVCVCSALYFWHVESFITLLSLSFKPQSTCQDGSMAAFCLSLLMSCWFIVCWHFWGVILDTCYPFQTFFFFFFFWMSGDSKAFNIQLFFWDFLLASFLFVYFFIVILILILFDWFLSFLVIIIFCFLDRWYSYSERIIYIFFLIWLFSDYFLGEGALECLFVERTLSQKKRPNLECVVPLMTIFSLLFVCFVTEFFPFLSRVPWFDSHCIAILIFLVWLFLLYFPSRTDTQTRTHTYTYTHTHIHTRMHTYIHRHTHTHIHTHTHTYIHTRIHTSIHTDIHTHTHVHTHTYAHIHTHTHTLLERAFDWTSRCRSDTLSNRQWTRIFLILFFSGFSEGIPWPKIRGGHFWRAFQMNKMHTDFLNPLFFSSWSWL